MDYYDAHGDLNGIIDAAEDTDTQKLLSSMLAKPALEKDLEPDMVQRIIRLHKKFLMYRIASNKNLLNLKKTWTGNRNSCFSYVTI